MQRTELNELLCSGTPGGKGARPRRQAGTHIGWDHSRGSRILLPAAHHCSRPPTACTACLRLRQPQPPSSALRPPSLPAHSCECNE